jgi:ribonuclease BN (tRNA processing enzyme)
LLDVADGASALLRRHGLRHLAIRSVAVSHMHADHHSGLVQLLKTSMHLGRREPLRIYLPGEALAGYQAFMELCYLAPELLGYHIEWQAISVDEEVELAEGVALRAYPNDHFAYLRKRAQTLGRVAESWRFESYSFLLSTAPYAVAYSGNLRSSLTEIAPWATGVDVLISELAHLGVEDCRKALQILRPRVAIFAHIGPKWDLGCSELCTGNMLGIRVFVAEDGDVYNIDELLNSTQSNEQAGQVI